MNKSILFAALLAHFVFRERLGRWRSVGLVTGFCGVALLTAGSVSMHATDGLVAVGAVLLTSALWAVGAGLLFALFAREGRRLIDGALIGLLVFSHWLLDLVVHRHDLALGLDDAGSKLGFALWDQPLVVIPLELGMMLGALVIYVNATEPKGLAGRIMPWFVGGMLVVGSCVNWFTPPAADIATFSGMPPDFDDDRELATMTSEFLALEGFETRLAHTPDEGVAALESVPPDLLILDVMLPQRSGFDVLRRVRQSHPRLPVLMLTGLDDGAEVYRTTTRSVGSYDVQQSDYGTLVAERATREDAARDLRGAGLEGVLYAHARGPRGQSLRVQECSRPSTSAWMARLSGEEGRSIGPTRSPFSRMYS